MPKPHETRRVRIPRARPNIEVLETRLAPATLVDAFTVTYQDGDGDQVQIRLSQPLFADVPTADQICHFDTGSVNGDPTARQQLQELRLAGIPGDGVNVKITVLRRGGDGRANVGFLNAAGLNLGDVRIDGDLGRIEAGMGFFDGGVHSFSVGSMGRFGLATQGPGGTLESFIAGHLERFEIASDVMDSSLFVDGELTQAQVGGSIRRSQIVAHPIGSMTVDGSLRGEPMNPTTITGIARVFQMPQTRVRYVEEVRVIALRLPERLADRLGSSVHFLSQRELDALQAKLARNPLPPGAGVVVDVRMKVRVPIMETFLVEVRTKAIEQLTVGGSAEYANILAEFGGDLGMIHLNGAWRASNISAGILPGGDGLFGTEDDIPSFAGSVLEELWIGGPIEGTPAPDDHFGIVASEIRSARIGRKALRLTTGTGNDDLPLGATGDVRLRESAPADGGLPPP